HLSQRLPLICRACTPQATRAWDLILSYPANFSVALISSGEPIGVSDKDDKAVATARLPVWGFAGTEDKGTFESDVRNAMDSLNAQGGNGTFTLIEGADHYVESFAPWEYDNGAGFDFVLANSKMAQPLL
ncbi:hypothetical protein BT69DRAFT_1282669, partial [Atractiella rhizophila]